MAIHPDGERIGDASISHLRRDHHFRPDERIAANEVYVRHRINMHVHEFFEVAFVTKGAGVHIYGTSRQRVGPGDLLLINPSVPHGYVPESAEGFVVRNVMFTAQALEHVLPFPEVAQVMGVFLRSHALTRPPCVSMSASPALASSVDQLIEALLVECQSKASGYRSVVSGLLTALLAIIWRACDCMAQEMNASPHAWERLLPAIQLIYGSQDEGPTLEALAESCGWSPSHFSKLFRSATGQTVREFTRRVRVQRAAARLIATHDTVDHIAATLGYSDSRAFRRAFQACTGMTPSGYREAHARAGAPLE